MIEATDRLNDSFWTENELYKMALDAIELDRYAEEQTHIVFYHLLKDGVKTGLVMILTVKSVIDGQEAIDKLWKDLGITAIVGEYNEESYINKQIVEAIYLILNKYKYNGKQKLVGSDKVYKYEPWMGKLI